MTTSRKRIAWGTAAAVWAAVAVGGVGLLMASTRTPDPAAAAAPAWPGGLTPARRPGRPTLVVCLHPRCPCSGATLDALAGLLGPRTDGNADGGGGGDAGPNVMVLFAMPDPLRPGWADTALVARARALPGVTVVLDAGGRACAALDARSSGQAFLYDAAGRLTFAGGLTPGRGEAGGTPGVDYVARALATPAVAAAPVVPLRADVFGCMLYRSPETKAAR